MVVLAIAINKMSNILLIFRVILLRQQKRWKKPQLFLLKRIIESLLCWVSFRKGHFSKCLVIELFNHKNCIPLTVTCTATNALRGSLKRFYSHIRVPCFRFTKVYLQKLVVSKSNKKAFTYFVHNKKQSITYSNPFSIVPETNICRYFAGMICCNISCGGFNHPFCV